jgi:protein-S-isoprenylcysteine O-methyltransferase Ste14
MSDLIIYLIAYALLLVYGAAIFRIVVRRDYARRGRLSVAVSILQALVFFVYGGFPILYLADDWPAAHVNQLVHITGLTLIIVGLGFLFYAMIGFGVIRSLGRARQGLKQLGLYRKSRNPQALACSLYVIGFALLWPSWQAVGWAVLYFVLIYLMILTEEEHLLNIHGDEYMKYCQEVPRFISIRKKSG